MNVQDFLDTFSFIERLERQPRSGWHQAGVRSVENVAAHSYAVSMIAMWLSDYLIGIGENVDVEKVLRMALLHDVGEAITTDLPKPIKEQICGVEEVERNAERRVLQQAPEQWGRVLSTYVARGCIESRIVKAADGLQMMLMALQYERDSRLDLEIFFKKGSPEFVIVADLMNAIRDLRTQK